MAQIRVIIVFTRHHHASSSPPFVGVSLDALGAERVGPPCLSLPAPASVEILIRYYFVSGLPKHVDYRRRNTVPSGRCLTTATGGVYGLRPR